MGIHQIRRLCEGRHLVLHVKVQDKNVTNEPVYVTEENPSEVNNIQPVLIPTLAPLVAGPVTRSAFGFDNGPETGE